MSAEVLQAQYHGHRSQRAGRRQRGNPVAIHIRDQGQSGSLELILLVHELGHTSFESAPGGRSVMHFRCEVHRVPALVTGCPLVVVARCCVLAGGQMGTTATRIRAPSRTAGGLVPPGQVQCALTVNYKVLGHLEVRVSF